MEKILKGGRGPSWAVAPLERERVKQRSGVLSKPMVTQASKKSPTIDGIIRFITTFIALTLSDPTSDLVQQYDF
jgi:hypothetical protein